MSPTAQQRHHFDVLGFLPLRGSIPAAELKGLKKEFRRAMGPKSRYREGPEQTISRFLMDEDTPKLGGLADDPRFVELAEALLGRPVICVQVVGYYYMGATPWHSDNYDLEYDGVKFAIYLDRLDGSSGALRLLPGSHRNPLWQQSSLGYDTEAAFGVPPEELPAHVFESSPGDVIAFQHAIWHASFHGGRCRRMVEVNYYADPRTPEAIRGFEIQMQRNHSTSSLSGRQMYPRYWRESSSRRHRAWIARLRELGLLETPGVEPLGRRDRGARGGKRLK